MSQIYRNLCVTTSQCLQLIIKKGDGHYRYNSFLLELSVEGWAQVSIEIPQDTPLRITKICSSILICKRQYHEIFDLWFFP
jgi:hypothetical protein